MGGAWFQIRSPSKKECEQEVKDKLLEAECLGLYVEGVVETRLEFIDYTPVWTAEVLVHS